MLSLGDMRGSILPLIVVPCLIGALWLLLTLVLIVALVLRAGSKISSLACIGYGLLMAIAGTAIILSSLPHYGAYGPGP